MIVGNAELRRRCLPQTTNMAPDCGSCAHDAPKESGLVGPTCCCASFLRPFDWPASWPGSALLRLKGGAPDSAQNAENSKSKTKVKTVVFGLKRVIPVSENAPENATALAVSEAGTILALGSDEEILAKYGNDAEEKIELKGKTVVPGFIDGASFCGIHGLCHADGLILTMAPNRCQILVLRTDFYYWIESHGHRIVRLHANDLLRISVSRRPPTSNFADRTIGD